MQRIMTYYLNNNKIIARSYPIQGGSYIFDEGSAFETKDPVSGLYHFFETRHKRCETKSGLARELRRLKYRYPNLTVSEQEYR